MKLTGCDTLYQIKEFTYTQNTRARRIALHTSLGLVEALVI